MITQVDHAESWRITIDPEEGVDRWPASLRVPGTKRAIRPDRVIVEMRRGHSEIWSIRVTGERVKGEGRLVCQYQGTGTAPEWVQILVEQARRMNDLGPGRTEVDW